MHGLRVGIAARDGPVKGLAVTSSGDATDAASSYLRIKFCCRGRLRGEVVIDDDGELLRRTGESQCSTTLRSTVVLQVLQNMLTDSVSRTAANSDTTS